MKAHTKIALLLMIPAVSLAQVPVDDEGNVIGNYQSQAGEPPIGEDSIPHLSQAELQELVGPIALYPDDLLAIVLPASAYPLQIVEAGRFLEALESDPTLKPNADWDDSIVALLNYPEVIELLNEDLDWTLRLGEAVVAQQPDVVSAVEAFRDRAYAAGNLKSDEHQTVARGDDEVIYISPVEEDVIYVPYYEPAQVVYYQPRPVYHYYPRSYPVYYYPYATGHYFDHGFFWGVTTAFSIGWMTDSLHIYHHSYHGHPYYGRSYYWDNYWYRRPSLSVYNTFYGYHRNVTINRHSHGDRWRPRESRREYTRREGYARSGHRTDSGHRTARRTVSRERQREPISFRARDGRPVTQARVSRTRDTSNARRQEPVESRRNTRSENTRSQRANRGDRREDITFRPRDSRQQQLVARTQNSRRQESARTQDTRRTQQTRRTTQETRRAPTTTRRSQGTRRQEPVVRSRTTAAPQARQQAPARTGRAPARQDSRQAAPRRQEQSSRSSETSRRSGSSSSEKSERRSSSSDNRGRSRDRR